MTQPVTPKRRSGAFRALLARLRSLFDTDHLMMVAHGALDHSAAEKLVQRRSGGRLQVATLKGLSRLDLAAQLVRIFDAGDEGAYEVVRELDRATRGERSVVASATTEEVIAELGSNEALRLRRHGAKLVWAMARDEQPEVNARASQVVREYLKQTSRIDRARAAAAGNEAEAGFRELEELYRQAAWRVMHLEEQMSAVDKERALLTAQIGQREAALRMESDRRRELSGKLEDLMRSQTEPTPPRAPMAASPPGRPAREEAAQGREATTGAGAPAR